MNVSRRCKRCGRTRTIGNADTRTIGTRVPYYWERARSLARQGGSAPLTSLTQSPSDSC
jgi:hypothetical protein